MRYEKFITRQMLRDQPDTLFVFGDNLLHYGMGGQAREMRYEPNAVGIPTKRAPLMREDAFFTDADVGEALPEIYRAVMRLVTHALAGGEIVWPADGIGTGLAELEKRAPILWNAIEFARRVLAADGDRGHDNGT